jgi:hypothetical protein
MFESGELAEALDVPQKNGAAAAPQAQPAQAPPIQIGE